jgi:hypothetical protein
VHKRKAGPGHRILQERDRRCCTGDAYPVRQEIKAMYKAQGKEPPKEMDDTVVYNRGILWVAVHVEAIRNALVPEEAVILQTAAKVRGFSHTAPGFTAETDRLLEGDGFEPSVPHQIRSPFPRQQSRLP